MRIKKGDNVIVIAGKDKGKQAKVLEVFAVRDRVLVEGVNVLKRHQRARKQGQAGQVLSVAMPVHTSNVMLVDPKSGKRTRLGIKMVGDKKVRVAKRSGAEL
ncbi:MAG: 50S ribosomal protein L24 [Candidatus Vogelbacteria bacterium CG10_big_fil_rev_8_21_14_0_10_51_16]|uniref:Large ribosomal subunit protein uL24 n=1 Tax=Candidatus Vogelbacteria bacterium CG10_big_fil_rev_8_21_14_0_10_51_16 TaxID=1975045 RepID=A0A2H0RDB6_9BACT|nr:MAG: 50S ribosomal protein L24 [Candidatus Vogelbacteria bacterium CG10_big_fil_rev_8_21_14_0_10_51_16]